MLRRFRAVKPVASASPVFRPGVSLAVRRCWHLGGLVAILADGSVSPDPCLGTWLDAQTLAGLTILPARQKPVLANLPVRAILSGDPWSLRATSVAVDD